MYSYIHYTYTRIYIIHILVYTLYMYSYRLLRNPTKLNYLYTVHICTMGISNIKSLAEVVDCSQLHFLQKVARIYCKKAANFLSCVEQRSKLSWV